MTSSHRVTREVVVGQRPLATEAGPPSVVTWVSRISNACLCRSALLPWSCFGILCAAVMKSPSHPRGIEPSSMPGGKKLRQGMRSS